LCFNSTKVTNYKAAIYSGVMSFTEIPVLRIINEYFNEKAKERAKSNEILGLVAKWTKFQGGFSDEVKFIVKKVVKTAMVSNYI
jgi:hypothetical protein